jgi:hypothetical protein
MAYDRLPVKFQHPDDLRQNKNAQRLRNQERNWAERICEPNRIYDALTNDAGYNHNYHAPQAPAIVYDTLKGKYVQASSVTQLSNPVKQHIMRQDTKRVMKSYVSNTDW